MRRRIVLGIGAGVWFLLVFLVGVRLTFPSDAVAERLAYEVEQGTRGGYALQLGGVLPAVWGVRLDDVTLLQADPGESPAPLVHLDRLTARTGPLGWLRGVPRLHGRARMGDGGVRFDLGLRAADGTYRPTRVLVDATGVPLSALPPVQGAKLSGSGGLDLDVDLDAATGFGKANGRASLTGNALVIEQLTMAGASMLEGFGVGDIPVGRFDLVFDVAQGRARVERGVIATDLLDAEIEGDILLDDDIGRSRLRLKVVMRLSDTLPDSLRMVESMLAEARWADGRYHYAVTGSLDHPMFRPERERSRAAAPRPSPLGGNGPGFERVNGPRPAAAPLGDDELDARREERRQRREERIRERRERMERDGPGAPRQVPAQPLRPQAVEDDEPYDADDELDEDAPDHLIVPATGPAEQLPDDDPYY